MNSLYRIALSLCTTSIMLTASLVPTLAIWGEMTRIKPEHVQIIEYMEIPKDFIGMHKCVMLMADVMFVNGLPFLIISSRGISLVRISTI